MRRLPSIPKQTCPKIDAVITMIEELQAFAPEDDQSYTANIEREAIALLEVIRQANSDLRENVEHYIEEFELAEKKITELENQVENLSDEINTYVNDVRELEMEVKRLEKDLQESQTASCGWPYATLSEMKSNW